LPEDAAVADYSQPKKTCDLVMKGGVTSGLVYPRAALQLAEEYRFKCIGGTSAGAVAAAFTAAAEYNRDGGGFDRLDELNRELQEGDKLSSLFQPSNATRPALNLFLGISQYRKDAIKLSGKGLLGKLMGAVCLVSRVLKEIGVPGLVTGRIKGALVGVGAAIVLCLAICIVAWILGAVAPLRTLVSAAVVLGLLLGVVGWVAGGLGRGLSALYGIIVNELPANHFGICNGLRPKGAPQQPEAVTEWLHRQVQRIAGRSVGDPPLTIGELEKQGIELKTVTTNLNLGRPYVLPFAETSDPQNRGADAAASARFIFRRQDMEALFPDEIVDHLVKRAFPPGGWKLAKDFYFLPAERDFPAVVAARMSMSFPLFFSSIPLFQLPRRMVEAASACALEKEDLIPSWFSDGGIASNFPIHFFDAWIPTRPTFAIARDAHAVPGPEAVKDVWLPQPGERVAPDWTPLREPTSTAHGTLGEVWNFLWSVFDTAQNYRDNMQAELPSYADRVVQVRLEPNEGGFNLKMPRETIAKVVGKGNDAGTLVLHEFSFDQHQWVRFRILTEQLDEAFSGLLEHETSKAIDLDKLHGLQLSAEPHYHWRLYPKSVSDASVERVALFTDFMKKWINPELSDLGPGDALARLRITPRI
jgi:predicted acylesterase/phospholipase RssA